MDEEKGTTEEDRPSDEEQQESPSGEDQSDARKSAEEAEKEADEAKQKVKDLEEDPPEKLEDWPDDKAKYETFGGAEGDESYEESVTSKLGPSSLRHREDGSVEVEGEEVDDPEEYKGEPIPGGPTDPKMSDSRAYGEPDLTDETSQDVEGEEKGNEEGDSGEAEEESSSSSSSSDDDDGEDEGGGESG
jgi:hypothetical protein